MKFTMSLIGVLLLALFFALLTRRAWHARHPLIKWPGTILSGLLTVLCAIVACLAPYGIYRLNPADAASPPEVQIAGTPAQLERGERLARLCTGCHSSTGELPLDGGPENHVEGMGTLYAPNLTPGGPLAGWTDAEIMRAIREGIHQNGRSLLLMPSDQYHAMRDADVRALVAYLRAQPAITRQTPKMELNLIGAIVVGAGFFPTSQQPPVTMPVTAPSLDAPEAYGRYLVTISGCAACHGQDLRGGDSPFTPTGPNLPAILSTWSAEEFIATIRTGVDPTGHRLDAAKMPWDDFAAAYSDEELRAIYTYLKTVSPVVGVP